MPKGWAHTRRRILARDKGVCYVCHLPKATHVDHIVPVSRGGTDDDMNLASICVDCHQIKTSKEARGGRRKADEIDVHPGLKRGGV